MLRLEFRSNNAYDTVILVDTETSIAISQWEATPEAVANFLDAAQIAADWDNQHGEYQSDDFGDLIAYRQPEGQLIVTSDPDEFAERMLTAIEDVTDRGNSAGTISVDVARLLLEELAKASQNSPEVEAK